MTPEDWATAYRRALPVSLRPAADDRRYLSAAAEAYARGWSPKQLADVVADRNYLGASNPILLAIMRLEQYAPEPPRLSLARHPSGCVVCPPWAPCPHPVTEADLLPAAYVAERMQLIRELAATPDMGEDEREECMRVLIADQRRRPQPV